jgi:hypothetical protein
VAADVQILRYVLITITGIVLSLFLIGRGLGRVKAVVLFGLYFAWLTLVLYRGYTTSSVEISYHPTSNFASAVAHSEVVSGGELVSDVSAQREACPEES